MNNLIYEKQVRVATYVNRKGERKWTITMTPAFAARLRMDDAQAVGAIIERLNAAMFDLEDEDHDFETS